MAALLATRPRTWFSASITCHCRAISSRLGKWVFIQTDVLRSRLTNHSAYRTGPALSNAGLGFKGIAGRAAHRAAAGPFRSNAAADAPSCRVNIGLREVIARVQQRQIGEGRDR